MHRCSYAHEFNRLPDDVRVALEQESYGAFMGTPSDVQPDMQPSAPVEPTIPRPLADTTRRLLATASFASYTRGNHALSERIAHEAVEWCSSRWAALEEADPLLVEEDALNELARSDTVEIARTRLPPTSRHLLRAFARELLDDPQPERSREVQSPSLARVDGRARVALVAERWREAIRSERETYRTRELGRALGSFVRELESSIPELARAQSLVQDLFGADAALWDLGRGQWTTVGWGALQEFADLLGGLPELERLAHILGRSRISTEMRQTTRVRREVSYRPVGLGKTEVTGVNFGDDLTSLLPSEVALLADPHTEDLFYAKLAHKEMLQLDYRRERTVRHVRERLVPVSEEIALPRGPVILCIDTSGSMLGDPEQVAKAMTLALARRVLTDRRDLYVITFSTSIQTLALSATAIDLAGLCEFLGGSFHGGTDLRPALAETLAVLQSAQFALADVLVISDFKVPKIADRFIDGIKAQQRRGTLFHSLTIARGAVRDPLHIFDNSWLFDVSEGTRGIKPDTLRFLS